MTINLIVAIEENGGIGYKDQLLYHLDLKRFKELTTYNEYGLKNFILFGRKSYDSLSSKPLPNRINVVVSRQENYVVNDHHVVVSHSLDNVINQYLSGEQQKDLWICGGSTIYEQSIPFVDKVYLTHIHDKAKNVDTYFNLEWLEDFVEINREEHWSTKYGCRYDFVTYNRKEDVVE